jgi:hypothetical protein
LLPLAVKLGLPKLNFQVLRMHRPQGRMLSATFARMPGCRRCSDPARIASTSVVTSLTPPHIHVDRDNLSAKFWLNPVQLAGNFGFRAHELREIRSLVVDSRQKFLEAWNEFFGIVGA